MEISTIITTITTLISIISIILAGAGFYFARKDKSNKDTKDLSYQQGASDANYKNIMLKLEKIEEKLEGFDKTISNKVKELKEEIMQNVKEEIEKHELKYHNKEN